MISIQTGSHRSAELSVEMVERKGLGHPDTLADLVAEEFSKRYSKYCLERFGVILNHWVDKVMLKGATAKLDFGKVEITNSIRAYLFGRVTEKIGDIKVDVSSIFRDSVSSIFGRVFSDLPILDFVEYVVDTNWASGKDHSEMFYFPTDGNQLSKSWDLRRSNDTVMCTSFAPYTKTERLTIDIENYLNSADLKNKFPESGWDIKVLIVRNNADLNVTICVPFIASRTPNIDAYKAGLVKLEATTSKYIEDWLAEHKSNWKYKLKFNTKDKGENVYLTAFGTALDKGDYGAVGRGNKYQGLISVNRSTNIEAVSGKNPVNHSGKLLTIAAHEIAWQVYETTGSGVVVNISMDNGDLINNPSFIHVSTEADLDGSQKESTNKIISNVCKKIPDFYLKIIEQDCIESHICQPHRL